MRCLNERIFFSLCSMWNLPDKGLKPCPCSGSTVLTPGPPGKSWIRGLRELGIWWVLWRHRNTLERRQGERVRARRNNMNGPGNSLLQSARPWVKGDPRLVMLPGRQLPFHIKLFRAHLISNHEQFWVTQHQAGPYVLVLLIVPGFWQRTLLSRSSTIFHRGKLLDKVVFSSQSSLHSSTYKGPGSTLEPRA